MKSVTLGVLAALTFFGPLAPLEAAVPNVISHQGRVSVQGVNFTGTGLFKFLIYEAGSGAGSAIPRWSNASTTPATTNEPTVAVTVPVSRGLFTVPLGDSSVANMAALPSVLASTSGQRLFLRVWFDDGVHGAQALVPDAPILSVPFALQAAGMSSDAALGLGTSTPLAPMDVMRGGTNLGRALLSTIANGQPAPFLSLGGARSVVPRGNLLAVSAFLDDSVVLADVSNLAAPQFLARLTNGVGYFTNMDGCYGLAFKGNLLVISAVYGDTVTLVDVSNPALPAFVSQIRNGVGAVTYLDGPYGIAITNNLMAIGAYSSSAVNLFDITTPSAPVLRSVIRAGVNGFGSGMGGAYKVAFLNPSTLVIGSYDSSSVVIANVANPSAPTPLATLTGGLGEYKTLNQVGDLAIDGSLLAVSSFGGHNVLLIDVSTPSTPVKLAEISEATLPSIGSMRGVALRENRLACVSYGTSALFEFDISDRSAPRLLFEARDPSQTGGPAMVNLYGVTYLNNGGLAVASESSSRVGFYGPTSGQPNNVSLVVGQRLGIGIAAPRQALDVAGNALIDGDLQVYGDLTAYSAASKPGGGSWLTLSDARYKAVQAPFTRGLEALEQINPVAYQYTANNPMRAETNRTHVGVLAQEVEQVVPEAVSRDPHGTRLLNNDPLFWTMLNAIKELKAENESLRLRLEKLEKREVR